MTFLDHILQDVADELSATKLRRSIADIRSMVGDAPPVRSLVDSLSAGFGLIAEVKERSPSVGPMREKNVADALHAYEETPLVRGISVLTNNFHFGMTIERLQAEPVVSVVRRQSPGGAATVHLHSTLPDRSRGAPDDRSNSSRASPCLVHSWCWP